MMDQAGPGDPSVFLRPQANRPFVVGLLYSRMSGIIKATSSPASQAARSVNTPSLNPCFRHFRNCKAVSAFLRCSSGRASGFKISSISAIEESRFPSIDIFRPAKVSPVSLLVVIFKRTLVFYLTVGTNTGTGPSACASQLFGAFVLVLRKRLVLLLHLHSGRLGLMHNPRVVLIAVNNEAGARAWPLVDGRLAGDRFRGCRRRRLVCSYLQSWRCNCLPVRVHQVVVRLRRWRAMLGPCKQA